MEVLGPVNCQKQTLKTKFLLLGETTQDNLEQGTLNQFQFSKFKVLALLLVISPQIVEYLL